MITEALGTGKNDNTDSRFCFFQNKPILYLYKTPFAYKKYSCTAKVKYKRSLLYMKATGIVRRIDYYVIIGQKLESPEFTVFR